MDLSQGKAGATSVLGNKKIFVAANAFKRAFWKGFANNPSTRTYPWLSDNTPLSKKPQIVHIQLPRAVQVSAFSFRSRPEPIPQYRASWILKFPPSKFDFVGSNDCNNEKWTTIMHVKTKWTKHDQEQIWKVPEMRRQPFSCIGFRVLANGM